MSAEINALFRLVLPPIPNLTLPPLPDITNPELERQVFTHSSYHALPRNATAFDVNDGDVILDNEKLEHIGDALLGAVVTSLLHQLYPDLKQGPATILKSHLVSNITLSQISHQYRFPGRIITKRSELYNLQRGEKTTANLFEAYIAGLFYSFLSPTPNHLSTAPRTSSQSNGEVVKNSPHSGSKPTQGQAFDHLDSWLYPLFTPLAEWAFELLRAESLNILARSAMEQGDGGLDEHAIGAVAMLNEHCIVREGGIPEYVASRRTDGDMWTVSCIATLRNGTVLEEKATRGTKKAASTVAAWKICQILFRT